MSMRPLDKLAREICWAGFADPKSAGCTKAQYWRRLSDTKRAEYRSEAEHFAYLLSRVNVDVLNEVSAP